MSNPSVEYIGWHKPAIELVADKLFQLREESPIDFCRATVVVPTAESGRRLREYMAEHAERQTLLMPRIIQLSQLISTPGDEVAGESETLAAWLEFLNSLHGTALEPYAPLIPRCPKTHQERWRIGVARKLMRLRARLEAEEVTIDRITGWLQKRVDAPEDAGASHRRVYEQEQLRWRKLGELFTAVDAILQRRPGRLTAEEARAREVAAPRWRGACRRLILACIPELTPQDRRYLGGLHGREGGQVLILVNAPKEEASAFDSFGTPLAAPWNERDIDIPQAFVFREHDDGSEKMNIPDPDVSTLHLADDAPALAEEALRLCSGRASDEVVIGIANSAYTPYLQQLFEEEGAWRLHNPEGRSAAVTQVGLLPGQLADVCSARAYFSADETAQGGMVELNAFAALMNNRALQAALQANRDVQMHLQHHVEKLRELLLPGSVKALCDLMDPDCALATDSSRDIKVLSRERRAKYAAYARKVSALVDACTEKETLIPQLTKLAGALTACYEGTPLHRVADKLSNAVQNVCDESLTKAAENALTLLELLRALAQDAAPGMQNGSERAEEVGDVLGWRELPFARGQRVIFGALHEGCIPEPVPEDEFLPQSLINELGMLQEADRTARDAFLLTALIHSRPAGEVHFIIARQNPDGSGVAPSSLVMRCGAELPQRARILFSESATVQALPPVVSFCLRQAAPGPEATMSPGPDGMPQLQPGQLEDIAQIAPEVPNPFTAGPRTYSPSLLSTFLQCPLSFWLRELFGLDAGKVYDDEKSELESNEYGTLMHAVLQHLVTTFPDEAALTAIFPEADADSKLVAALEQHALTWARKEWDRLYAIAQQTKQPSLPLTVQLRCLENTLYDFVYRHVQDVRDGWCNVACEYRLEPKLTLPDGTEVSFSMIADRIDYHPGTGCWRIIDYKTSSGEKKPLNEHLEPLENEDGTGTSLFSRYMNAEGFTFPMVPVHFTTKNSTTKKYYRWRNVQLPLYTFGLQQLTAKAINDKLPDESLSGVLPDLYYYNLQSRTQSMQCYPFVKEGQVSSFSGVTRGDIQLTPTELLESAMQTVISAIGLIRAGKCLFSAESLHLKRPFSRLTGGTDDKRAHRFGALSPQCDPRSMFRLTSLPA